MRWLGLVMGSLLGLAALPTAGKDKPKPAPVYPQCMVEHSPAGTPISLIRTFWSGGNTDFAKLSVKARSLYYNSQFTLALDGRYQDRSTVADPQGSKVTITTKLREPYERPSGNPKYALRLYGVAGPVDFPVDGKKTEAELTLPVADFEARFGAGDVLDLAVVMSFNDGSSGEMAAGRIDLNAWRKRVAMVHNLRAALDALPPGPDTSCLTRNPKEQVTFSYDCQRVWSDAQGEYRVERPSINWTGPVAPGVKGSISLNREADNDPRAVRMFSVEFEVPGEKPVWRPTLWIGGRPTSGSVSATDLSAAMGGTAPVWLVFERAGQRDRRVDLSPILLGDVIGKLLAGVDAVRADELAPVGRCKVARTAQDPTLPLDIVI